MALQDLLQAAQQPMAFPIPASAQIAGIQAQRQQDLAQEMQRQQAVRAQQQALQLQLRAAQQDAQRFLQEMQERKFKQGVAPHVLSVGLAGEAGGQEAAATALRGSAGQLGQLGVSIPTFQTPRERAQGELSQVGGIQGLLARLGQLSRGGDPLNNALNFGMAAAPFAGALETLGVKLPDQGQIFVEQAKRQAGREHLGAQLAGQRISAQGQLQQEQIRAEAQIADQIIRDYNLDRRTMYEYARKAETEAGTQKLEREKATGYVRMGGEIVQTPAREKLMADQLKAMGLGINPQTGAVEPTLDAKAKEAQARARGGQVVWGGKKLGPTTGQWKIRRDQDLAAHERLRALLKVHQAKANNKSIPPAFQAEAKRDAAAVQREIMDIEKRSGITGRGMTASQQAAQRAVAGRQQTKERAINIRQQLARISKRQDELLKVNKYAAYPQNAHSDEGKLYWRLEAEKKRLLARQR